MRTKIEEYKKAKSEHQIMTAHAYESLNEGEFYNSSRDKHGLSIGGKWHDQGEDMGYLTGYSGFYGDSGCAYTCDERLAAYLKKAINARMGLLVELAIEISKQDVEVKLAEAKKDAEMVLNDLNPNP